MVAIKLTDKSGYRDNGYPDLQTLGAALFSIYFAVVTVAVVNIVVVVYRNLIVDFNLY